MDGKDVLRRISTAMLQERYLALYEWHLGEGWSWSSDTHLTMFGYPSDAWEVNYENWASRVHPDDIGEADGRMQALISGEVTTYRADYRFLNADDQWQWVQSVAYVTERDDTGATLRVSGIILDAQQAKARDAQHRHVQQMDLLGQITGGVAHDFNNLLAILTGCLEELREDSAGGGGVLADMADALQRGQGLTQALLRHARREPVAATQLELKGQLQNLRRVLEAALGDRANLTLELPEAPIPIVASSIAFDSALLNLLVNAKDALPPTGGTLVVRLTERRLDEAKARQHGLREGRYAVVDVVDDGCGMAPEVSARATEPLFSTKGLGRGTGLGLSTVKKLVVEAGGAIELQSELGAGTTVTLYFPSQELDDSAPRSASRPSDASLARLLIVDDEPAILRSLSRQLRQHGYAVETASNPRRALAELQRQRYELLLTDIVMPYTIDGIELAERALAAQPDLAVVFMSGFAAQAQEKAARAMGDLIAKPFSTETMHQSLLRALRG